jgi:hypothetical protein
MEQTNKGATISDVVFSVIADRGEDSMHKFNQYLHWALEGLQDWHMDSAQEIKTVQLTMNDYKAVDWPSDYVDWCKIGVQYGDKVATFSVNDKIALFHDTDECGNILDNLPVSLDRFPNMFNDPFYGGYWFSNFINVYGEHMGKLFGYGGAANPQGSYTVNRAARQFQFDSSVTATTIYLEYISTGFTPTQQSYVNEYAKKLLKYYVHMCASRFKNGIASADAQVWERTYWNEYRLARARVFELTPEDVIQASRKYYMLAPKT